MSKAYRAGKNRDSESKVFCFFSSEKKAFFPFPSLLSEIEISKLSRMAG